MSTMAFNKVKPVYRVSFVDAPIFALCTSVIILHVEFVATVANVPKGFVKLCTPPLFGPLLFVQCIE